MSTKNDTNRGDCYPYTIQENKNEPFIISRACPPNCVEDKIKEALSANNEKWEARIKELEENLKESNTKGVYWETECEKLEETALTKEEVRYIKHCMVEITNGFCATCENSILAKLQKIIGGD